MWINLTIIMGSINLIIYVCESHKNSIVDSLIRYTEMVEIWLKE
jgi:hypothetical protein